LLVWAAWSWDAGVCCEFWFFPVKQVEEVDEAPLDLGLEELENLNAGVYFRRQ
jgi:hypothetical protein